MKVILKVKQNKNNLLTILFILSMNHQLTQKMVVLSQQYNQPQNIQIIKIVIVFSNFIIILMSNHENYLLQRVFFGYNINFILGVTFYNYLMSKDKPLATLNNLQNHYLDNHSSQSLEEIPDQVISSSVFEKNSEYEQNRKWTKEQHILYIIFLQESREKIKSKLIRRSNSFFKEMAAFIESKSSTQCRSYHQKFEVKYKYPYKIIRQQKEKVDIPAYQQIYQKINQKKTFSKIEGYIPNDQHLKCMVKKQRIQMKSNQCQTDIQGVQLVITVQDSIINTQVNEPAIQIFPYYNYPMMGHHYFGNPYPWN